jgi:hypothetical protein
MLHTRLYIYTENQIYSESFPNEWLSNGLFLISRATGVNHSHHNTNARPRNLGQLLAFLSHFVPRPAAAAARRLAQPEKPQHKEWLDVAVFMAKRRPRLHISSNEGAIKPQ